MVFLGGMALACVGAFELWCLVMMHAGDEAAEWQRHVLRLFCLERRELYVQVASEAGFGVCRRYGSQVMVV